ncbi:MAG: thioredoxin family protein [Planctomycetales bacterium]|nr:thioredoxin family protein [Planctomycetales bacterium]
MSHPLRPLLAASLLSLALAVTSGPPVWAQTDDFAVASDAPAWHNDVSRAWQDALEQDRPLLMYITSPSCGFCRKMTATTYADRQVASLVSETVVAVAVDGQRQQALVRRHLVRAFPTTLVIAPDGREIGRFEGYVAPRDFRRRLAAAIDLSIDPQRVASRPTHLR